MFSSVLFLRKRLLSLDLCIIAFDNVLFMKDDWYPLTCFFFWVAYLFRITLHNMDYVIRMSLLRTFMSSVVCHSYVLLCHPYVTRMYSYVINMSLLVLVWHSNLISMYKYTQGYCAKASLLLVCKNIEGMWCK